VERLEIRRFILEKTVSVPSETSRGSHAKSGSLSAGWHDFELASLPPVVAAQLSSSAAPFLNSLPFCVHYNQSPAQRVWLKVSQGGAIEHAVFYRIARLWKLWNVLEISGYALHADQDLAELMQRCGCRLAIWYEMCSPEHDSAAAITHDVIVDLPGSAEAYLQSLGKQKRQQLPRYWRRLQREMGDVQMQVQCGSAIGLETIIQLVHFNQHRMEHKGKHNAAAAETQTQQRRWPLTQQHGLLCTVVAGDRVLGGTFNYVFGDEAFLIVIAHDPALEHLNIGNLSVWKTAEYLIERGFRRYHLFWGRKLYKTQFGGRDHPVYVRCLAKPRWLGLLWRAHFGLKRNIPRGWRFLMAQTTRRFKPKPAATQSHADQD
jgi:hypothetical protein